MKLPYMPHKWIPADALVRWAHCAQCGIIKRRDGQNSRACKGPARITLRRSEKP